MASVVALLFTVIIICCIIICICRKRRQQDKCKYIAWYLMLRSISLWMMPCISSRRAYTDNRYNNKCFVCVCVCVCVRVCRSVCRNNFPLVRLIAGIFCFYSPTFTCRSLFTFHILCVVDWKHLHFNVYEYKIWKLNAKPNEKANNRQNECWRQKALEHLFLKKKKHIFFSSLDLYVFLQFFHYLLRLH